jgi:hypothetical protein
MGMFDEIMTPDLRCVMCGRNLTDLQTKDGECMLEHYEIGDKFPLPRNMKFITAYTSCTHQYEDAGVKSPFNDAGIAHWRGIYGVWIEAQIPVDDATGRIKEMEYWTLTYQKMRMNGGVLWTDIKPGQFNAQRMSAVIGDRIRKYYGTVDDGLYWKEIPERE